MLKRICAIELCLAGALLARGEDWSQYAAGSDVVLGSGEHVVASAAELAIVNGFRSIAVSTADSRLVFAVPTGTPWRFQNVVSGAGGIVKRGAGELNVVGQKRVRADGYARFARYKFLLCDGFFAFFHRAGKQNAFYISTLKKLRQALKMLFRQNLGRRHHNRLIAALCGIIHKRGGH